MYQRMILKGTYWAGPRWKLVVEYLLQSIHVIFADKLDRLIAEEITVYDYILREVRGSTSFMGGILIIGTLGHLQIQPIDGRPFLIKHSIIP